MWQDAHDSAQDHLRRAPARADPDAQVSISDERGPRRTSTSTRRSSSGPARAAVSVVTIPAHWSRPPTPLRRVPARPRCAPRSSAARSSRTSPSASRPTRRRRRTAAAAAEAQGQLRAGVREGGVRPQARRDLEPVLTQFGYHLIRVDSRKGDTLDAAPHPAPHRSRATRRPRPSTARPTSWPSSPPGRPIRRKFDEAAKQLGLHGRSAAR